MFFLSLFMDLMMLLNISAAQQSNDYAFVLPGDHATHGHLPGPPDAHFADAGLATHAHHGQHGHSTAPSGGDHFFH